MNFTKLNAMRLIKKDLIHYPVYNIAINKTQSQEEMWEARIVSLTL